MWVGGGVFKNVEQTNKQTDKQASKQVNYEPDGDSLLGGPPLLLLSVLICERGEGEGQVVWWSPIRAGS